MKNYSLLTFASDRMVSYEPIVARSDTEAVYFVHGMLTERSRNHTRFLSKVGARYVLDRGEKTLDELSTSPQTMIRTWHMVEHDDQECLVWEEPKEE